LLILDGGKVERERQRQLAELQKNLWRCRKKPTN
jgi:hypothetical protein